MKLKYVIFDLSHPVLFPLGIPHIEIANGVNMKPTSAGFITIDTEIEEVASGTTHNTHVSVSAFGESISLGLKSDTNDSLTIERLLNN